MDSASQSAKEVVLSCTAALEAAGFVRPPSLSPDAYLAALSDLEGEWTRDLGILATGYATLRFGGGANAVDHSSIVAAAEGVARRTDSLNQSGEIAALRDAWRASFSAPVEPAEDARVSPESGQAVAATSGPAPTTVSKPDAPRSRRFDLSPFRLDVPVQVLRRLSETSISLRAAGTALFVAAALGSIGTYCLPEGVRAIRLAFESRSNSDPVGMPGAPVVAVMSPPLPPLSVNEGRRPAWPQFYSPVQPHADLFNNVIADTLSDLASLHRGIGDPERAEAIYAYVADSRPGDFVAQMEYATYLLNPEIPEHRDVDRACEYAERAYDLNSRDARTVRTFTDALFATGDATRAVEIQQRWLDQERPSDIASNAEDRRASDRSAG